VPIFPGDEEDEVVERVQVQEHQIYPLVVNWFAEGRLAMRDNAAWLDGERLTEQGPAAD
jgi:phosphoribosylglycinamide formyltransferase-1